MNISARAAKGQGKVTEIINILEKVTLGSHFFQVAKLLRESIFLNGILTNSEVWYGVSQQQVEQLEFVDKLLLRKFLDTPQTTPLEGTQLEFGVISIGTIIKARRVNYLHYLLQTSGNEMLHKVFVAQLQQPVRLDWTTQVQKDLKDFKIDLTLEEIKSKSTDVFKTLVRKKSTEYEFSKLMMAKQPHTKMNQLNYPKLEMPQYLKDGNILAVGGRTLFRYRTHMANYRQNFGNNNGPVNCQLCGLHLDNQYMAFYNCHIIKDNVDIKGKYEDIFKQSVPSDLVNTLVKIEQFRKENL